LGAPLVVGDRVLGVLCFQDMRPGSVFSDDQERLAVALARQIAVALDNLRLVEETRQALADLDAANRLLTGQAWRQYALTARSLSGEWQAGAWVSGVGMSPAQVSVDGVPGRLTIPLRIRGEVVGEFDLLAPSTLPPSGVAGQALGDEYRWTPEDVAFAQSLVDQVGQTLETARLLEETERLAGRERLINEMNARVRQTVDVDGILQTAVDELGRSLKASRVVARIGVPAAPAQETSLHATSPIHETWPASKSKLQNPNFKTQQDRPEGSAADVERRDRRDDDNA
jgi:GAF domain-containing protein